ncbi:hypothetical protein HGRIS_005943 [Hohenbuehelia grisea]|uniref:FAD-dependent oxidoreductase 2 FAD-binding domain-containing protein n=1 Tax=Hohenbuehelia grisea TaxID=104357 RepID=A0ABR3K0A2_9AGAR
MFSYDCVVVGSGHAGSCAALSAIEHGCKRVLIVDKCPAEWVGGNGYFTAGAHRTVHGGLDDLQSVVRGLSPSEATKIDMTPYTAKDFTKDIMTLSKGQSHPDIVEAVVNGSRDAITWLTDTAGIPFVFSFNRQAYEINGRQRFWGGMVLSVEDGGKGLIAAHQKALQAAGVETWFNTPAVGLTLENGALSGVQIKKDGNPVTIQTSAVVLAAGGFESNRKLRAQHLGENWANVKVRGTPYNTGDGFELAKSVGAKLVGDWGGCHSTCWDANAPPDAGDRELTNQFTKSGYPIGIMVNSRGARFVDEGEDFRNYTYAKFGRAILGQPGGFAFQIWDSKVTGYLRNEEYGDEVVDKVVASSLRGLAVRLSKQGLEDTETFLSHIGEYNDAVRAFHSEHADLPWNPAVKDGLSTQSASKSLPCPKTNWALTVDEPPFTAVKVGCGITFTFGGLAIDAETSAVIAECTNEPIPGIFCTGEMVGGLFYNNYPGGSGLTAGAVFGRKAGRAAARLCSGEL